MYTKILIPLDGSKTSERVLPFARALARTLKLPVELLEVVDLAAVSVRVASEKEPHLDALIAEGERECREHLKMVAGEFPGSKVSCTVERGTPADVIIERANADNRTLIAMATHGRSGVNRWVMGSVAEKVLRGSESTMFLVRADEDARLDGTAMIRSIVVPLDGSELAESVLPSVVNIANALNLEVILCRAYELAASAYYGSEDYLPNYDDMLLNLKKEVEDYLTAKVAVLRQAGLAKVSWIAMAGAGADEIVRYSREHPDTLIAMCTHGRSGVRRWVLGSVTERVVRRSEDPVLVVHAA